jgi:hypothetical protein
MIVVAFPLGAFEKPKDQGIGGTGVVGTITGFGSIFINGLEIQLPWFGGIRIDGGTVSPKELKIGQVARLVAWSSASGLSTRGVDVEHEVIGPIKRIDHKAGLITVLGQKIYIRRSLKHARLGIGDWVAISGLRRIDHVIVASLIEHSVAGKVQIVGSPAERGAALAELGASDPSQSLTERAILRGMISEGSLSIGSVSPLAAFPIDQDVQSLLIEGYYSVSSSGRIRDESHSINGLHVGESGQTSLPRNDVRAIVSASVVAPSMIVINAMTESLFSPVLEHGSMMPGSSEDTSSDILGTEPGEDPLKSNSQAVEGDSTGNTEGVGGPKSKGESQGVGTGDASSQGGGQSGSGGGSGDKGKDGRGD